MALKIESIHINFLSAEDGFCTKDGGINIKISPYFSVVQGINCAMEASIEERECRTEPLGCIIVPSKTLNKITYHFPVETKIGHSQWIFFDLVINNKYKLDDVFNFPIILPSCYNNEVYEIIHDIRNLPDEDHFCDRMSLCYKLIKILQKTARPKEVLDNGILDAIVYIKKHYTEKLTTKCLARRAKMSVSHFHRCFKRHTGRSPIDYVNDHRLTVSTVFLEQSFQTINFISSAVGFCEPYYYSKLFTRKFGMTPSAYRKASLTALDKNSIF